MKLTYHKNLKKIKDFYKFLLFTKIYVLFEIKLNVRKLKFPSNSKIQFFNSNKFPKYLMNFNYEFTSVR